MLKIKKKKQNKPSYVQMFHLINGRNVFRVFESRIPDKGIDFFHLRESSVYGESFAITTRSRVRHLGIRHRCHSRDDVVFWNIEDSFSG